MKLALRVIVLFMLAVWLEQSLLPFILPGHVSLRLVALLVMNLGFMRGPNSGAWWGFLLGLPVSVLAGEPMGIASLALTCVGWGAGQAAEHFHLELPAVMIVAAGALLALEWLVVAVTGWLLFDVAYRFSLVNFLAAMLASPAVFRVTRPLLAKPGGLTLYG